MVNTRMFVFKHPKYYKELRKRNKSDQAISYDDSTESQGVRPGPGLKQQAASDSQVVNQRAPESWPNSSEVVETGATCPAAKQDNECRDCRACWDPSIKTIKYGKH